jgi:acyl-CoA thioester hydrolase
MQMQPLDVYRGAVPADWIDYNGHMNIAYYMLVFDRASDVLFDRLDVGPAYRQRSNHTLYVLEAHITYERELKEGDTLRVTAQLIDADAKRLHFFFAMHHAEQDYVAATTEMLALHVDLAGPRSVPLPAAQQSAIKRLLSEHRSLERPAQLGRVIGIRRQPSPLPPGEG